MHATKVPKSIRNLLLRETRLNLVHVTLSQELLIYRCLGQLSFSSRQAYEPTGSEDLANIGGITKCLSANDAAKLPYCKAVRRATLLL